MSNEKIWVSTVKQNHEKCWYNYGLSVKDKINGRLIFQYEEMPPFSEDKALLKSEYEKEIQKYAEFSRNYKKQRKILLENQPDRFYKMPATPLECSKSIFIGYGAFLFVNEATAKILQQYNLGDTQLMKMDPYDAVSGEQIEGGCSVYLFHIAEGHEKCEVEKSCNVYIGKDPGGDIMYYDLAELKDDSYAVKSSALKLELDLWVDHRLNKSIFMSHRLKTALDDAGFAKDWHFNSCVVVEG